MLSLAWLFFIAWLVLMLFVPASYGFAGPQFWCTHIALILGVMAWAIHFTRKRYATGEVVLLCLFVLLAVGSVGSCAGVEAYKANQGHLYKRTLADMRMIATAWEERATRTSQYNAAGAEIVDASLKYKFGPDALAPMLVPTYIKVLPQTDGWGHAWQFATDEPFPRGGGAAAQAYFIRSAGRNGRFDPIVAGHIQNYDCDIVYSNGTFIAW